MLRAAFEITDHEAAQQFACARDLARENQNLLLDLLLICP